MKNTKNKVRLTESQLHNVIKESVRKMLKETNIKSTILVGKKNNTISSELKALCDRIEKQTGLECTLSENVSPKEPWRYITYDKYSCDIIIHGVFTMCSTYSVPIKELNIAFKMCQYFVKGTKGFEDCEPSMFRYENDAVILMMCDYKDYGKGRERISNSRAYNREMY